MDGNGRWAKERGLPRIAGHREGAESLRAVLKACAEFGVKYLTVYAFSTENWRRPKEEVEFLMNLFSETIDREMDELMVNRVKLNFLGRLSEFSPELQKKMKDAMEKTKGNDRITLNVMVNYGGRAELVDAVNRLLNEGHKIVDEDLIGEHLYTKGIPDPDLLIRTASEMRVSNYLLWQIAYSEIYVTPVLWPDFRKEQLKEAIQAYQKRVRKFGKTEEQISAS
jgi:undecaprenyl diphosphate synthase